MPGRLRVEVVAVTPLAQNCTLLWDDETRAAAIVDPGGDIARIVGRVGARDLRVERILLTHGHFDHAGGAAALAVALGGAAGALPVEGPGALDRPILDSVEGDAARFGIADARGVIPTRFLREGDRVAVGSRTFEILHVPGHTPGHVVFVDRDARFAQIGDTLFAGSIGRTDFPYGDGEALLAAIATKLLPLGDDLAFVCGHGPGSTIGAERRGNPFLRGR